MENTITLFIEIEDKEKLKELADQERLSLSSYCRQILTQKIKEVSN